MGQLSANVETLTKSVSDLSKEIVGLKRELNNINLFRAKVVGMSIGASTVTSILSLLAFRAMELWAK